MLTQVGSRRKKWFQVYVILYEMCLEKVMNISFAHLVDYFNVMRWGRKK